METGNAGWSAWTWGERVGALVGFAAVILLFWAAVQYGAGNDVAFFGLALALALGVSGLGIHVAAREARYRRKARDEGSAATPPR